MNLKKIKVIALLIAIFLIAISIFGNTNSEKKPSKINWLSYEEAQKLNAKKPRKIFIDTYTDWCGWCKKMDATTLNNDKIANYLNQKFYAVKLNAESEIKTIYKGQTMTERELASKIFRATSFPTTVYLDEKENVLQPLPGYLEVDVLDKILHYFGENFHTNTEWKTFESTYQSK